MKMDQKIGKEMSQREKRIAHYCSGEKQLSGRNVVWWVDMTREISLDRVNTKFKRNDTVIFPKAWLGNSRPSHTHACTVVSKDQKNCYQSSSLWTSLLNQPALVQFLQFSSTVMTRIWSVVVIKTKYSSHSSAKNTHGQPQTPYTQPKSQTLY